MYKGAKDSHRVRRCLPSQPPVLSLSLIHIWLSQFLDTVSLGAREWRLVIMAGFIPTITAEVLKLVWKGLSTGGHEVLDAG